MTVQPTNRLKHRRAALSINLLNSSDTESLVAGCESSASSRSSGIQGKCAASDDLDEEENPSDHDDESNISNNNQQGVRSASMMIHSNASCVDGSAALSDPDDTIQVLLQAVVEQLEGKIKLHREQNRRLVDQNKALQHQMRLKASNIADEHVGDDSTSSQNEVFTLRVLKAMNDALESKYRRWSDNQVGELVAKAVGTQDKFRPHLLKCEWKHFREKIFTPYNILREMDLAGGTLSYEGIDVLRCVETCGVARFRGSIIPSNSELKRMAGVVECFAREYCPFLLQQTTTGECVEFN